MKTTNKMKITLLLVGMLGGYQVHAAKIKEPVSNPNMGTWVQTLEGRDINQDGIMDGYFDTTQNITWWAQMSLGSWNDALKINEQTWGGVTGWRLPHAGQSESSNEVAVLRNQVLGNGVQWINKGPLNLTFAEMKSNTIWEDWSWSINPKNTWVSSWDWAKNNLVINKVNPDKKQEWIWGVHDGDVLALPPTPAVPEPESYAMALTGLMAVLGWKRKNKKQ